MKKKVFNFLFGATLIVAMFFGMNLNKMQDGSVLKLQDLVHVAFAQDQMYNGGEHDYTDCTASGFTMDGSSGCDICVTGSGECNISDQTTGCYS